MVRFSDMLGGSGDTAGGRATNSPYAALASDNTEGDDETDAGEPDEREPDEGAESKPEPDVAPAPAAETAPSSAGTDFESPEAVLDRLTQYATSARTADHGAPRPPDVAPVVSDDTEDAPMDGAAVDGAAVDGAAVDGAAVDADDPLSTPGDDFLPRPKGIVRKAGRGRRRHP